MSDANEAHDTAGAVDAEGRPVDPAPEGPLARVENYVRAHPLASLMIALGIGYVIGRLRAVA